MRKATAREIKDLLIEDGILEGEGFSFFEFLNIKTKGNNKSSIGYIIQDWLADWMDSKDIYHSSPENSQVPPDFYLCEDKTKNLLEVKAFDYEAGPNFDVANYEAYVNTLIEHPSKIDSDYLIFGYTLKEGVFSVEKVWLKKVWEITRPMNDFPLNVQNKRGVIYNIRPAKWYSDGATNGVFGSKEAFLQALQESLEQYSVTKDKTAPGWLDKFNKSYNDWLSSSSN